MPLPPFGYEGPYDVDRKKQFSAGKRRGAVQRQGTRPAPARIRGSSVVSAYPLNSGIGAYSLRLFELGFHEELAMFKIVRSYPEDGFDVVLKHPLNVAGAATFLSLYANSRWGRYASRRASIHFTSPDWFHAAKYNPRPYGTVHDVFAIEHPEWFSARYRAYFRREMEAAAGLAGLVAVSRATARSVRELFPDLDPIVIHNWTGPEFRPRDRGAAREALGLPRDRRIVLSVGSDLPRKNVEIVRRLAGGLPEEYAVVRLGAFAFSDRTRVEGGMGSPGRIVVRKGVPRDLVPLYYNAADVLVAPSLAEGFDLPVVEAINSGIPVVASDIDVHREIMMGRGRYADPHDPDRWIEEVQRAAEERDPWSGIGDYYREGRAAEEYARLYGFHST